MVGLGLLMVLAGVASLWLRYRKTLFQARTFQRYCLVMGPSGLIALLAGWVVTEVGRQPYTVYGLLRTAESASPIAAPALGASLAAFVITYFFVFGAGIYYLFRSLATAPGTREGAYSVQFNSPNVKGHLHPIAPEPSARRVN